MAYSLIVIDKTFVISPETARELIHDGAYDLLKEAKQKDQEHEISEAVRKVHAAIDRISGDMMIPPDEKAKLIAELRGAISGGNINLANINTVLNQISSQATSAEVNTAYEVVGNAYAAQNFIEHTYDINTERGRHDFARAFAGPHATEKEVQVFAESIKEVPALHAAATKLEHETSAQRRTQDGNENNAEKATGILAAQARDRALTDHEATDTQRAILEHLSGRDPKFAFMRGDNGVRHATEQYAHGHGRLSDVEREANRAQREFNGLKAFNQSKGENPAEAEATAQMQKRLMNMADKEASYSLTYLNKSEYAAAQKAMQNNHDLDTGSDQSRINAYVRIYTEKAQADHQTVDQTVLRSAAEAYVHKTPAKTTKAVSYDAMITAAMEGGVEAMRKGDAKAAHQRADEVASLMEKAGFGEERAAIARAYLNHNADVTITALNTLGKHDAVLATLNDAQARKEIEKRAAYDIEFSKSTTQLLHTGQDFAETIGSQKMANSWGLKGKAADVVGGLAVGADHFATAATNAAAHPIDTVTNAWNSAFGAKPAAAKPAAPAHPAAPAATPAHPAPAPHAEPTLTQKAAGLYDSAVSSFSSLFGGSKPAPAKPVPHPAPHPVAAPAAHAPTAAQLTTEQHSLEATLTKDHIAGHIDEKTHKFVSADGKKTLNLTGDAAKDLIAIQQALHGANVQVASNSNHPAAAHTPAGAKPKAAGQSH